MLALLLVAQVASQAITFREPHSPERLETRLSGHCDAQPFVLRWTVRRGHNSSFDEISTNGSLLPASEIDALNCWKGDRSIAVVNVICEPHGRVRPRVRVEFEGAERLGLPALESFEIIGNRLVFERRAAR